jgi:hypothetical protein
MQNPGNECGRDGRMEGNEQRLATSAIGFSA